MSSVSKSSFPCRTVSIMTPPFLFSDFQLPFKRDCVTLIKDEDPLDFLEEMQEGDEKEGETADPANHEQYWSRLDVLDPGWDARP